MKRLITFSFLCFLFFGININAQSKDTRQEKREQREDRRKEEAVKLAQKNMVNIESLNFSFYPNTIEPQYGVTTELIAGDYYLTVDKTSLYMNLPYIGSFYVNPLSPSNAPINITSSKFLYSIHTTDNINFQITIIPSDLYSTLNEGIKFVFSLNKKSGFARLSVTADNRQEITYTGSFN